MKLNFTLALVAISLFFIGLTIVSIQPGKPNPNSYAATYNPQLDSIKQAARERRIDSMRTECDNNLMELNKYAEEHKTTNSLNSVMPQVIKDYYNPHNSGSNVCKTEQERERKIMDELLRIRMTEEAIINSNYAIAEELKEINNFNKYGY